MDPLAFISKLLGATWKVGAAIAVVAGVIFYGRQQDISIFVNLNDTLFQTIIVAGLIGAAIVAIDLLVAFARFVRWLGSRIAQHAAGRSEPTKSKKNAQTTYYLVPDYVWNEIDKVLKDFPLPPSQPWLRHP